MWMLSRRVMVVVVVAVWGVAAGAGLVGLAAYQSRAGVAGAIVDGWPAGSGLKRGEGRATVVVVLHPKCPCSRATVAELERVLAQAGGARPKVVVLAVLPDGTGEAFAQTGLIERVRAIPGVEVRLDARGLEAKRFGATTSGHVACFGSDGRLLFSGGITPGRGHEGESAGAEAVMACLRGEPGGGVKSTPVFGCELESCRAEAAGGEGP